MRFFRGTRRNLVFAQVLAIVALGGVSRLFATCGPFTDTAADAFCPLVLEIFYQGITTGTTATTYSPGDNVTRLQMAAFLSRSVDGVLKRGSRRAIGEKFWTPSNGASLGLTTIDANSLGVACDGADVWIAHSAVEEVSRVRASDGKLLETWTGASFAYVMLVAMDSIFAAGDSSPGKLYRIIPSQPAGAVTTVATLGAFPSQLAFDGARIWAASGPLSIVTPGASLPWTVTNVVAGFSAPNGLVFDGANIWVTDFTDGAIFKVNASGGILQTVVVGTAPHRPVFDGTNIWVPNRDSDSVTVVRASNGAVLATLTGNGLDGPEWSAFDGERVLVTNSFDDSVSLWKAASLTPLGGFSTGSGTGPRGACSDGLNFWLTLYDSHRLARF